MAQIPTPLRAALGLMANAIEGARTLPDKAVELPVRATFDDEPVSAKPAAPSAQPAPPPTSAAKQPRARKAAPAKKAAAKKTAAAKAKTTKRTGAKTVRAKRSAEPSAFDAVGDASAAPGTSEG